MVNALPGHREAARSADSFFLVIELQEFDRIDDGISEQFHGSAPDASAAGKDGATVGGE